ncbi:MAG: DUF4870 domain-containing protein [Actinomycetota bacterium]
MVEEKKAEHPDLSKKSSTGMDPKLAVLVSHAGILLYGYGGWLSGLIIYILEKENKFVKFQAMQSMIIGFASLILRIVLLILGSIVRAIVVRTMFVYGYWGWWSLFGWLAWFVVIGELIIRIAIIMKTQQGENYKFPFFGKLAEKYTK